MSILKFKSIHIAGRGLSERFLVVRLLPHLMRRGRDGHGDGVLHPQRGAGGGQGAGLRGQHEPALLRGRADRGKWF